MIGEMSTGYPGYDSVIPKNKATIGTILQGQWLRDLVVRQEPQHADLPVQPGRPVRSMAQRDGLRVFLWVHGRRNQPVDAVSLPRSYPDLSVGREAGLQPDHRHGGRGDQVHEGVECRRAGEAVLPLLRPGGTHAPHHPTPEWIKKISDMHLFDKGWNALRETIFANQKKLGVIPANTQLTPWPDSLPKWDTPQCR